MPIDLGDPNWERGYRGKVLIRTGIEQDSRYEPRGLVQIL